MDIKIGIGLDNLCFGFTTKQVEALWEKPTTTKQAAMRNGFYYIYNTQKTTLFFDQDEDFRLFSIETANEDVRFSGKPIIGEKAETVMSLMRAAAPLSEKTNYGYWEEYEFESIGISINIRYGKVKSLTIEPLWNDDEILWPKTNSSTAK